MRKKDRRNWYTKGNAISPYHSNFDLLIRVQSTWQPIVISLPCYQTEPETYLKYIVLLFTLLQDQNKIWIFQAFIQPNVFSWLDSNINFFSKFSFARVSPLAKQLDNSRVIKFKGRFGPGIKAPSSDLRFAVCKSSVLCARYLWKKIAK